MAPIPLTGTMTIGKFPAVKGKCPFCNFESDMVVVAVTRYEGEASKDVHEQLAVAISMETNPFVEHDIALPTWFSRVLLCGNCGAAHVQDDKAAVAEVRWRDTNEKWF